MGTCFYRHRKNYSTIDDSGNYMMKSNVLSKVIPIICFICVFLETYIIYTQGVALQYEKMIYDVFPFILWILFILVFFLMFLNIFLSITKKTDYKSTILTIIASVNSLMVFSLIPLIRNYYFYNPWDSITHLGYVKDIVTYGTFGNNYYPVIHIISYVLSVFSGIEPRIIMLCIPQMFVLFFIISLFVLVKVNGAKKELALLATALAILPIFGGENIYFVPSAAAFFLIPLVLYLFLKTRTEESNVVPYSILMVIYLLLLPFFHLEVSLVILVMLIIIFLVLKLLKRNNYAEKIKSTSNYTSNNLKLLINRNNILPLLIMFIAFFTWFSSSIIFGSTVTKIYDSFTTDVQYSAASIVQSTSLPVAMVIYNILKSYGVNLFFISISAIVILYILFKRKFSHINLLLISLYVGMLFLNIITFFYGLIVSLRTVKYLVFISIFLVTMGLYKLNDIKNIGYKRPFLISIALLPLIILTVFAAYPSPLVQSTNLQVTEQSFEGMSFFIQNKQNLVTLSYPTSPYRFQGAIVGNKISSSNKILVLKPVNHFGYKGNLTNSSNNFGSTGSNSLEQMELKVGSLGNFYSKDVYLVMDDLSRMFGNNGGIFIQDDFEELKNDKTVNEIYDNGGFNLYRVKGAS